MRAATGAWDPARPTEGAYSALLTFEDGAFASLAYSGYAHFDSDEFTGWIGEMGRPKDRGRYGAARKALHAAERAGEEAALKAARNYGGSGLRRRPRRAQASRAPAFRAGRSSRASAPTCGRCRPASMIYDDSPRGWNACRCRQSRAPK